MLNVADQALKIKGLLSASPSRVSKMENTHSSSHSIARHLRTLLESPSPRCFVQPRTPDEVAGTAAAATAPSTVLIYYIVRRIGCPKRFARRYIPNTEYIELREGRRERRRCAKIMNVTKKNKNKTFVTTTLRLAERIVCGRQLCHT